MKQWSIQDLIDQGVISDTAKSQMVPIAAVVRYVATVIQRERVRLAKALEEGGIKGKVGGLILNDEEDAEIFRWVPPPQQKDAHTKQGPL